MKWIYSFEHEDSNHVISKPHGSLNFVFETNWSVSPIEHGLNYFSLQDKLATCPEDSVGITKHGNETRPWIVGYLPDYLKHEHNTNVHESDISHDLCRLNVGALSMALQDATSLSLLGYSMPKEDEWVWAKICMLMDRDTSIHIISRGSSEKIKQQFLKYGFSKVKIENGGKLNG